MSNIKIDSILQRALKNNSITEIIPEGQKKQSFKVNNKLSGKIHLKRGCGCSR
jgi:hypothetical protein